MYCYIRWQVFCTDASLPNLVDYQCHYVVVGGEGAPLAPTNCRHCHYWYLRNLFLYQQMNQYYQCICRQSLVKQMVTYFNYRCCHLNVFVSCNAFILFGYLFDSQEFTWLEVFQIFVKNNFQHAKFIFFHAEIIIDFFSSIFFLALLNVKLDYILGYFW